MIKETSPATVSPMVTIEEFDEEDRVPLIRRKGKRVMIEEANDAPRSTRVTVETSFSPIE